MDSGPWTGLWPSRPAPIKFGPVQSAPCGNLLESWVDQGTVEVDLFPTLCVDYSTTDGCLKRFVSSSVATHLETELDIANFRYHLRLDIAKGQKLCRAGYVYNRYN